MIIYYKQVRFIPWMQEWLNICESVNGLHHINKRKDKNHIIISIDTAFDNVQHAFMIKTHKKFSIEQI